MQIFFKISVLQKFRNRQMAVLSLFNKVTGLKVCSFMKKDSSKGAFLWIWQIFENSFCYRILRWLPLSFLYGNCFEHPPTFSSQPKALCGLVSSKKVCWSYPEYVPYILLVETIPTRSCWLTCRKQKLV